MIVSILNSLCGFFVVSEVEECYPKPGQTLEGLWMETPDEVVVKVELFQLLEVTKVSGS